jgi:hexulose-6-phosphate isomerase
MYIGVNQFCFPSSYDVEEAINSAKKIGFDSIELCFTNSNIMNKSTGVTDSLNISNYYNRLLNVDSTDKEVKLLGSIVKDNGISISSIGGIVSFSIYPLNSNVIEIADKSMDAMRKMLDFAQLLETDTVLIIPGMLTEDMDYETSYRLAQKRVAKLAEYAPNIKLAIENVWNGMLYSPLEFRNFIDEIGYDNVGVYFDIGNARRFGWPEQWIRTLEGRIFKYHCKDYRLSVDNIFGFTNLLDGDINWPSVISTIRETGFDGDLVIELIPPASHMIESTLFYALTTLKELLKNNNLEVK